jgi:lysophospholipase L1-like esterase
MMVLWLIVFDQFVPPLLELLERRHYEGTTVFRFENSDLFALGPLVAYLREHPRRERRRVVFFGNSMIFGYFLKPEEAIPAQFQRLQPGARVYNAAINGQEIGTGYLVAKDILDSVDVLYIQAVGARANEMLPSLIPVDDADVRRFGLKPPDRVEARLQSWLGRAWKLYRDNDRLQAALFGTSTRIFVYAHKRDLARAFGVPLLQPVSFAAVHGQVTLRAPRRAGPVAPGIKPDFAQLARARGKRVVFLEFEWGKPVPDEAEIAAFNAAYAPFAETVIVHVPPEVTFDGMHPSPPAAAQIAAALSAHEAAAR